MLHNGFYAVIAGKGDRNEKFFTPSSENKQI